MWRNAVQQKRRTPETRGADHDVGLRGESLEVRRELPFNSFGFELRCDPAQPLDVAGVEQHALHDRRQTTSAAGTYISRGANDEQSCVSQVTLFERAHLFDALHDESNGQRIAGREHGIVFFRKLIEGNFDQLPEKHNTVFTTGNTLTVGFIVQGIKKMCALEERNLRNATLLIIGATGDVGSGCARCLAPVVKRVLLNARNIERLRRVATELEAEGVEGELSTDLQRFPTQADIVICAASLGCPSLLLDRIAPHALVCDAGYPKNLSPNAGLVGATVFFGGLGQIAGGLSFTPDFFGILNRHPWTTLGNGCLLEGMALALEGRFEPFSKGRGFITPKRVAEIETIAARHGIHLAPFSNADGPLERQFEYQTQSSRGWVARHVRPPSERT